MTAIEHQQIKGITIKNIVVTIVSTVSIVASVMTTYFGLKGDIKDIRNTQETQTRVDEIRLKTLEGRISALEVEIHELKDKQN